MKKGLSWRICGFWEKGCKRMKQGLSENRLLRAKIQWVIVNFPH